MTLADIKRLRFILNNSLEALESAYESSSLDFPSLDGNYDENGKGEQLAMKDEVRETVDLVIAASYQLLSTVRHPFLTLADASSAVSTVST